MPNILVRFMQAKDKPAFLRQYLRKKVYRNTGRILVHEHAGLTLLLDGKSSVDNAVLSRGEWEGAQLGVIRSFLTRNMHRNPVFLDIGSYWGLYALTAAQMGVRDVHAFEADRRNFLQLQAQMFLNPDLGVTARNLAISDREGTLNFIHSGSIPQNRGGTGVSTSAMATQIVPCAPIDTLVTFGNRLVVGKIDVEGHEAPVLRGMRALIAQNAVLLQIEQFAENARTTEDTARSVGLRPIGTIAPDCYYSNLPEDEIAWLRPMMDRADG